MVCVCTTRGLCVVGHHEVRKMSASLWSVAAQLVCS